MQIDRSLPLILAALAAACGADNQTSATGAGVVAVPDDPGGPAPLVACDPVAQDCAPDHNCTLVGNGFQCLMVVVDGAAGDPCEEETECGLGLACLPAALVPPCQGFKCCTPLCAIDEASFTCPGADQGAVCAPALTGATLQTHGNFGVCRL